jgi:hypothetical protein
MKLHLQSSSEEYDLPETEINTLGYQILYADHNLRVES